MSAPATEKICIVCKQDCAKKPRMKDAQGRYVCEDCMNKVQAKTSAPSHANASSPPPLAASQAPRPTKPDMLAPDEELVDLLAPPPPPKAGDKQFAKMKAGATDGPALGLEGGLKDPNVRHCPKCEAEMPGTGRICTSCGHDLGSLSMAKVPKHLRKLAPAKCDGCGYDMRGAASDICPECGKKLRAAKTAGMLDAEKQARTELYRPPIVLAISGWIVTCGLLAFAGTSAPLLILVFFVAWLVAVPLGVVAFWLCSLFYIEYDAPWHATALRIGGVFAMAQAPSALAIVVGINAFNLLTFGLLALLFMTIMEMDWNEAVVMAIMTRVVWWAAFFGLSIAFGL